MGNYGYGSTGYYREKRPKSNNIVVVIVLLILLVVVMIGVYFFGYKYYSTHFFGGTKINGLAVGNMTPDDVKYEIQDKIREYSLTCKERGGQTEVISGAQIYMQYVDDGSVESLVEEQNPLLWLFNIGRGKSYQANVGYTYDRSSIDSVINQMNCFQAGNIIAPSNAHLEDDGTNFYVAPSDQGNTLNRDLTKNAIINAIEGGKTVVDFEAEDLYIKPAASEDDVMLQKQADALNKMLSTKVVYDFDDRQYTVDSTVVRSFLLKTEQGYSMDSDRIAEWVKNMAYETDTFGLSHDFTTHSGIVIKLERGGDYGWCINREKTTEALIEAILNDRNETIEPVYKYKGVDRSRNDIGDTYVEVCIEEQTLWCYKDGELVVQTPVVTGNHARSTDTPAGCVWAVDARMEQAKFASAGVKVDFWMPFNGEVGLHDADGWRTQYGGQIYRSNGSHGCVNIPRSAMEKIYAAIHIGDPVIVYNSTEDVVGTVPTGKLSAG